MRDEAFRRDRVRHHHTGCRVGHHVREPIERIVRIQRQVCTTRLHHRQQSDHPLRRPWQCHTYDRLRTNTTPDQQSGQLVRPRIQLGVRHPLAGRPHRQRLRATRDLPFEQLRQRQHVDGLRRVVPRAEHLVAFGPVEEVEPGHRSVGVGNDLYEQREEPFGNALDGRAVDAVRLVDELQGHALAGKRDDGQRVVRRVAAVDPDHSQAVGGGQVVGVERIVLEHQQRVEQVGLAAPGPPAPVGGRPGGPRVGPHAGHLVDLGQR